MTPRCVPCRQLGVVYQHGGDTNEDAIMERPELMGQNLSLSIAYLGRSPRLCRDTAIEALGVRERNRWAVEMCRTATMLEHRLDTL
jgi:hypothetical protein